MKNEYQEVTIGNIPVGDRHPVIFMAEIGTFFNQDIDLALDYLHRIKDSGADILKTEILHTPEICLKNTGLVCTYNHNSGKTQEDYRALVERKVVPLKDYARLFSSCHQLGLPIVCSVYDKDGIDFVMAQKGHGLKISRDNISNLGLIAYAAGTDLPILFDAGDVHLHELALAVQTARDAGQGGVIINHHPAANPAPPEAHDLHSLATYKRIFKAPVGLACHYQGNEIMFAAVGAGVNIIEKGVDEDPDRPEQDLVSATRLAELATTVRQVKNCAAAMGQDLPEVSSPRDESCWKCLIAWTNIQEGDTLGIHNVGFAIPPVGMPASQWPQVEGTKALRDIPQYSILNPEDFR
ncbi:N-acetylneuraminate synthase family protein [Desulfovibrio ferrophilus]|uniref:Putative NeuB family protein n=1 Tax=Desulfovibrio ferrophilus TaxID=241368 RepID=A0A2Z6B1C2_9BACT|nr:N-acetylneuraminate synthase family protein [Desulfovibrio ferrophilus]BBD09319.1 putative NeuB family protein [Desulfovibrio ferrophilus]